MNQPTGIVYLVGAGPGDPGLLTLRGRECLRRADLVLYDGLVNPLLLRHSHAQAIRTCRVDAGAGKRLDQEQINRQLIDAARAGQIVVRLKGGDPFVFGRGSEEAAALAGAGIPFEVVPGVTAAIAACEYAGISFTHRELASAVAFVAGHEDPGKDSTRLDYAQLASFPGTLVFYMGLHRLPDIGAALQAAGKPSHTPVAVISHATLPTQQTVTGTLATIAEVVSQATVRPPSLIVVGDCVLQRERIAWFERRPLLGKRIGIARAAEQADDCIEQIFELGAEPVLMPTIHLEPPESWDEVDAMLRRLGEFQWVVFTSANGVRQFLNRLWQTGGDVRSFGGARFAVIGESTAAALTEFHLRADVIPNSFRAEGLAAALRPQVAGQRVLWARANRVRDVLRSELNAAGALLEELVVYRHHDAAAWTDSINQQLCDGKLDWIGVSSSAIARQVMRLIPQAAHRHLGSRTKIVSISPITTATCQEIGLPVSAEAVTHTWAGILDAILRHEGHSATAGHR